jgi:hypothetical protein
MAEAINPTFLLVHQVPIIFPSLPVEVRGQ